MTKFITNGKVYIDGRWQNVNILIDGECNITICPICFCNSCDIPDVLED